MPNFLTNLFADGAKGLVDSVGKVLDNVITTKDELEAAKLKMAEEINRNFENLQAQANDLEKAFIQDVQNARSLQIAALQQSDNFSKRFMYYLAAFIILSATIVGIMLFFYPVPENNKRMIEMFFDVYLFAGALSVIYFFFGSSKGSHDKTEIAGKV